MKHNIIQMTATTGLTVPHSVNPISQYIFDCLGFNPMNGNFDFVFQGLNHSFTFQLKISLNIIYVLICDLYSELLHFFELVT